MRILLFLILVFTSIVLFAQNEEKPARLSAGQAGPTGGKDPQLAKAIEKYHAGDYKAALIGLNIYVDNHPVDIEGNYYLANSMFRTDDMKGAMKHYNKVIELDAGHYKAYKDRGKLKANMQDYRGSIDDFNRSLELNPKFMDAYFNRGISRYNLRQYKASADDFTKVIEDNPKDFEAYFARGNARYGNDEKEAACKDYSKSAELGFFEAYDVIKMKCN